MDLDASRILVTGGSGFVGRRLLNELRRKFAGCELFDFSSSDIRHRAEVDLRVVEAAPTHVVHLAGIAAVSLASQDWRLAWDVNLFGTLNLIEAVAAVAPSCRVLHVSSGEVYGRSFLSGPAGEESLLQPNNTYALSKAAADLSVQQRAHDGFRAVIARPFNHVGPGQSDAFVLPAFASQIASIEAGLQAPRIKVGSLDEERDFLDVMDVVDAYISILSATETTFDGRVYNICSGVPIRIGDILDRLLSMAKCRVEVEVDPSRLRSTSIRRVIGNSRRLQQDLGWTPRRSLDETLAAILTYHRDAVRNKSAGPP